MKNLIQKRSINGQYMKKTNWIAVALVVLCIVTVGLFLCKNVAKGSPVGGGSQLLPRVEAESGCIQTGDHSFNCSERRPMALWGAYLEEQNSLRFKATVTAYTSEVGQTDSSPEVAANGENIWSLYQVGKNTCAINDIAFGSKLTVEGLGDCVVRDRMNPRYTHTAHLDFYFGKDTAKALQFGIKSLNVMVVR